MPETVMDTLREFETGIRGNVSRSSNFSPWQLLRDRCGIVLKAIGLNTEGRLVLSALDDVATNRWGRRDALSKLPPFMGGGGMVERVSWEKNSYALGYRRFEAGTPPPVESVSTFLTTKKI